MLAVRRAFLLTCGALLGSACVRQRVSDPSQAVKAYQQAAQRGDADALYAMLSARSQRELGPERTRALVRDAKQELSQSAARLGQPLTTPAALAAIRFDDGETSTLTLEEGLFKISAAAALPSAARTPAEALADLRRALSRRSYPALVRVLSEETRGALEHSVSAMVRGLEEPETLDVEVEGDAAEIALPGGHVVKLKRESGFWKVEDFR